MNLQRDHNSNRVGLFGWAMAAITPVAGAGMAAINQGFAERDKAMRLVRVRDMLAGQGWFDNIQHRLNPPVGTPMHWAQWIDAMLAAPIALLALIVGQVNAETALAFAWPLGLLGGLMFLTVRIGGELGPADGLKREAQWAATIVAALAFPTTEKFAPGSFDHHNIVLVLILASV
jgi:asparagine N-glycosylation enzyme membrane subunit Stt3